MFYHQATNKYIQEGTQFTIDGITYPAQWLNKSTLEEKQALGLIEVTNANEPFDPKYYWTSESLDGAVRTFSGIPKELDQLKTNCITQVKQMAYSILSPSDYIDIRNLRDPSYKPEWITWRDSIRAVSSETAVAINNSTSVDEIAEIMANVVWPNDPSIT